MEEIFYVSFFYLHVIFQVSVNYLHNKLSQLAKTKIMSKILMYISLKCYNLRVLQTGDDDDGTAGMEGRWVARCAPALTIPR